MCVIIDAIIHKPIRRLNIGGNDLSKESVKKLAEFLQKSEHLEELNLSKCNLNPDMMETVC